MRPRISLVFSSLALAVLCCGTSVSQIVFEDGQEHILTEDVDQQVIVRNQSYLDVRAALLVPGLEVDDATVRLNVAGWIADFATFNNGAYLIVDGGGVIGRGFAANVQDSSVVMNSGVGPESLDTHGHSAVTVNGGSLGITSARDTSSIAIDGGSIGSSEFGPGLRLEDSATMQIVDGNIGGYLEGMWLSGLSSARMTGGSIHSFSMSGGNGLVISDNSVFRMSGGNIASDFSGVVVSDNGAFQMSGGLIEVNSKPAEVALGLVVSDSAQLEVMGGQIHAYGDSSEYPSLELEILDDATATVFGTSFNLPRFEPIEPLEGTLVGTLLDGTPIEWRFRRSETATILLVPEPGAWVLCVLGSAVCLWRRRR